MVTARDQQRVAAACSAGAAVAGVMTGNVLAAAAFTAAAVAFTLAAASSDAAARARQRERDTLAGLSGSASDALVARTRAAVVAALGDLATMRVVTPDRTQVIISGPVPTDWADQLVLDRALNSTEQWEWRLTGRLDPATYQHAIAQRDPGDPTPWWQLVRADGSTAAYGTAHLGPYGLTPMAAGVNLSVLVTLAGIVPPPIRDGRL